MSHHVTNKNGRDAVRDRKHIEKIPPHRRRRQIAVIKAQGAFPRSSRWRKGGIALGQEDLLDLAGHVEVRLHLVIPLAQFLGVMGQLIRRPLALQRVTHRPC